MQENRTLLALLFASAALPATTALGQTEIVEVAKLTAPATAGGDRFGTSIAVDGDVAVIGAPAIGAAYVFERQAGTWTFVQELVPPAPRIAFGIAVDVDGDRIVVGDDWGDGPGGQTFVGAAHVFVRGGGAWTYEATLSYGSIHDHFGLAVGISGDWVVAGAPWAYGGCTTYFFARRPAGWELVTESVGACGLAVAIDGGTAVSSNYDSGTAPPGEATVLEFDGTGWQVSAVLHASDGTPGDSFGASLALEGDVLFVGAPLAAQVGAVYVFERIGSGWMELQQLLPFGAEHSGRFGTAVGLDGSFALVGASSASGGGPLLGAGAAYLFRELSGGWQGVAKLIASDAAAYDRLGSAADIARGTAIVGAPFEDAAGMDAGATYIFQMVRGVAFCSGDGSASPCPCGNGGASGTGCANSTGAGAGLVAHGTASVALDDLTCFVTGLVPLRLALLFAGLNAVQGDAGSPFGDGLRCAGGSVVRLGIEIADPLGLASFGPNLGDDGGFEAGDVRRFQVCYRDPAGSPCGSGFNLSNGWELQLRP